MKKKRCEDFSEFFRLMFWECELLCNLYNRKNISFISKQYTNSRSKASAFFFHATANKHLGSRDSSYDHRTFKIPLISFVHFFFGKGAMLGLENEEKIVLFTFDWNICPRLTIH